MTRHRYEIEFVPDDARQHDSESVNCIGTMEEARAYAEKMRPDHGLFEIVFCRCGEVAAKEFIPLPA